MKSNTTAKTSNQGYDGPYVADGPYIVVRSLWLEDEQAWRHDITLWTISREEAASYVDFIDMGFTGLCYNIVKAGSIARRSRPSVRPHHFALGLVGYKYINEEELKLQDPREMVEEFKDERSRTFYLAAVAAITKEN